MYTPEEVEAGLPKEMLKAALDEGKWEGTVTRVRRDGVEFPADTASLPQRDATGKPVGLLLISKSVSSEVRLSKVKRLLDNKILGDNAEVVDFLGNILESSTEYSIIGKDLEGTIILWNEGARRLYGYEPEEVIGKANSSILHTEEDVAAGKPAEMMAAALREGKWEGTISRRRKNGEMLHGPGGHHPTPGCLGSARGLPVDLQGLLQRDAVQ